MKTSKYTKTTNDSYKPKLVMSIHGYLSLGKWQGIASDVIRDHELIPCEFKYGFTVRFDKWKINGLVERFKDWYFQEVKNHLYRFDEPFHRPSIICHSLGSWIVAKALQKYPEIKFDKVFLHGSIIPRSFNWYPLIIGDQVNKIITERSKKDFVVLFGWLFTKKLYSCCRNGFIQQTTYIKYEYVSLFRHSDFQYKVRFDSQLKNHLYDTPVQLKVIHGGDVEMREMRRIFRETSRIDRQIYGVDYSANPISMDNVLEWAEIEKNIWSFLKNSYTGEINGYLNVVAVDEETIDSFILGNKSEDEIKANNIISFSENCKLNLIIMSLTLDKKTKFNHGGNLNSKPGELLIATLSNKILQFTDNGRRLNKIAAIAWTPVGESLCRSFGIKKSSNNYLGHPIYASTRNDMRKVKTNEVHNICRWYVNKLK